MTRKAETADRDACCLAAASIYRSTLSVFWEDRASTASAHTQQLNLVRDRHAAHARLAEEAVAEARHEQGQALRQLSAKQAHLNNVQNTLRLAQQEVIELRQQLVYRDQQAKQDQAEIRSQVCPTLSKDAWQHKIVMPLLYGLGVHW